MQLVCKIKFKINYEHSQSYDAFNTKFTLKKDKDESIYNVTVSGSLPPGLKILKGDVVVKKNELEKKND